MSNSFSHAALQGETALVTGASRGIGAAIAAALAAAGAKVPVLDEIVAPLVGLTVSGQDLAAARELEQVAVAATPAKSPEASRADLKARQEACLQEKVAEAERNSRMKSGFGKLFSAASRTAVAPSAANVA